MAVLEVEHIRSLVQVGTAQAVDSLGLLLAQDLAVQGLEIRYLIAGELDRDPLDMKNPVGVLFELKGGIGGFVGLFFSSVVARQLAFRLLGRERKGEFDPEADSVVCEIGNILASQLVSAIADDLGEPMMPSVPVLVIESAKEDFIARVMRRLGEHDGLWLETEILDPSEDILGRIVLVPEGFLTHSTS